MPARSSIDLDAPDTKTNNMDVEDNDDLDLAESEEDLELLLQSTVESGLDQSFDDEDDQERIQIKNSKWWKKFKDAIKKGGGKLLKHVGSVVLEDIKRRI